VEPGPDIEYGDNPVVRCHSSATGKDLHKHIISKILRATLKVPGVEGLSLIGTASYDQHFNNRRRFETPFTLYTWDGNPEHKLTPALKGVSQPVLEERRDEQTDWMTNLVVNYDRSIGDHNFGATLGVEAQSNEWRRVRATRKYFISDALDEINNGSVTDMETEGYSWKESRINYFGRVNYNYLENNCLSLYIVTTAHIASRKTNCMVSFRGYLPHGVHPKKISGRKTSVSSTILNCGVLSPKPVAIICWIPTEISTDLFNT
jgi:hypothetical protein